MPTNLKFYKKNWPVHHLRDQHQRNALSRGYKNSNDDDLEKFYRNSGETIYNSDGKPFFHHIGRGSQKPERFRAWREFWNNYEQKE